MTKTLSLTQAQIQTKSLNVLNLVKTTLIKEGKLHKAQLEMAKKPQI